MCMHSMHYMYSIYCIYVFGVLAHPVVPLHVGHAIRLLRGHFIMRYCCLR